MTNFAEVFQHFLDGMEQTYYICGKWEKSFSTNVVSSNQLDRREFQWFHRRNKLILSRVSLDHRKEIERL